MKKTMKKFISVILAIVMIFPIVTIITSASITLVWPVPDSRKINQGFHSGCAIDIGDSSSGNAKIVSATSGTVKNVFKCTQQHYGSSMGSNGVKCDGFGTGVVIQGPDGRFYGYAHMKANSIPSNIYVGASVSAGQHIGNIGSTGNSSGNHLHFQITTGTYYNKDSNINPSNETYTYSTLTTYTLSYNANGGSTPPSSQSGSTTYTISSIKPTRSGYTFLGWSKSSSATSASYTAGDKITLSSNTTLYAVWQQNHTHKYVLTDSYAATCTTDGYKEYTCSCDDKYTTVTQHALGHDFSDYDIESAHPHYSIYRCSRNGCSEISRTFDTNYDISCSQCNLAPGKATDVTVTAGKSDTATEFKWNAREVAANDINDADYFNVKIYRKESGSYSLYSSEKVNYSLTKLNPSVLIVLPAGSYYAEIVTVCGENISLTSCTDKYYFTVESSIATYTLTYNANGGSTPPSSQSGATTYTISSIKPTRSGYTFLGWSKSSSATSPSYYAGDSITISANTTLYAVWSINKCGNNLIWNFDEATGTLTISGTGDMYDWEVGGPVAPWSSPYYLPIKKVIIGNNVTSIGDFAFFSCGDITSVTIGNSVERIGEAAFLLNSDKLKSITIPNSVKIIDDNAFAFCSGLESITIPKSVTSIGNTVFYDCTHLTDIYYEGSKSEWEAIPGSEGIDGMANVTVHFAKDDIYNATFYLDSSAYNLGAEPIAELVFAHGSDMTACFAQAERGIASLKPGKKFVGWKNIDTGEIVNKNAKFTEDVEFYAVWTDYNSTVTIWGRDYETGGWRVISTNEGAAGTVFKINTLKSLVTESNYGTAAAQFVAVGSESTFSDDTAIRSDFVMPEGNKDVYIFTQTKFNVEFRIPEFDENGYITEDYYSDVFSYNSATDDTFRTVYITAKKPINAPAGYKFAGWRGTNGILYSSETITLDYANGTSYEFTAEYIPAEYTVEFVIDNSKAIKEIFTVEGTFSIGDKIRLSDAVVTKEDGTRGRLPVIGKENKEQPGGPYKNVDGYKFAGWKVGTQAANHVDFDITQEITITPEFIETVTFDDKISIKGYWEAIPYDFVAYYAKSFDADGNPVYEAMPAVKVKTGANLGDYLAAATETANENLPEGKKFSLWRTEDGSAVPNNMPAYGLKVYATYISESLSIFIDYNYFSKEFAPDVAERVVKSDQFSKYLYVGVDIENDIPDNEIISVAEMVRRMKIPDSLKPEGDYVLSRWKVYHVHDEAEVYDESKWHEGYNDEGTSIAKHPVIFQALWTDGLSGACGDDLTFVFDKDSGILTVNGTGDMWDWELFKDMPWYNYINDIEFVDISDGVTSIGDNAFYNCQKLEDVVIPDSVTKIGKSAFHNCTSLKDVIIPEGVTLIGEDAFYSCESIENITIPYGITAIGYRSFYLCNNLKSITIPVTVTSIGNYAFASCNRLTDVYFEGSKAEWNSISIGEENVMLLRAKIHYADCDHNFVPSVTVPATCTENGVMTYTCECGDSFTEEIPATGHVPGSWNVSIPASCTVDGESVLCCEECGIVLGNKNIPATGHVPGFWVIVVEPTTETEGSKIKCCDICGDLLEEESIPKLPPKEPVKDNAVVKNPSTSTISYGDAIILHVDASKIPEGGYVEWTADNGNFSYKPNDATCEISPKKSGDTTFTATIYDANGNAVSTDEQTMTAKAGFFDKIIAFFKGLFGLSKTYPSVFKGIF